MWLNAKSRIVIISKLTSTNELLNVNSDYYWVGDTNMLIKYRLSTLDKYKMNNFLSMVYT